MSRDLPIVGRKEDCPNRSAHTEGPAGYVNWHNWAERMKKTWNQSQCPSCGYWVILTPKEKR